MSEDLSKAGILVQAFIAAVSGGLSYFLLRSALQPYGSLAGALDEINYLAIGLALLVFVAVFYRIRRGSWTREHVDELFEIDDDS